MGQHWRNRDDQDDGSHGSRESWVQYSMWVSGRGNRKVTERL